MLPGIAILRTPATWVGILLLAVSVSYSVSFPPATPDRYAVALTAAATGSLAFVAPVVAALAAWEAGRLRRAGWWRHAHARDNLLVAAGLAVPAILAGVVAFTGTVAAILIEHGQVVPDARLLGLSYAVIIAYALVGAAVGIRVPSVVAAPMVLLVLYVWMSFPRAVEPLWLRHLTGSLSSCCQLSDDIAPTAVLASFGVVISLMTGALLLIRRPSQRFPVAALVPPIIGLLAGASAVSGMGPDPVEPRNQRDLICTEPGIRVCVWPEHQARLADVTAVVVATHDEWKQRGLNVPMLVTEATQSPAAALSFEFTNASEAPDIVYSLAYGMILPLARCVDQPYDGAAAIDYVIAWLAATAGMPAAELSSRFGYEPAPGDPDVLETVDSVLALGSGAELAWFRTNLAAVRSCDKPPSLVPEG